MAETNNSPVSLDFGSFGGVVELPPSQVVAWIDKDLAAWGWIGGITDAAVRETVTLMRSHIKSTAARAKSHVSAYVSNPVPETLDAMVKGVPAEYEKSRVPIQGSPVARFVQDLASKTPIVAMGAFAHLIRAQINLSNKDIVEGTFLAFAYTQGWQGRTEQENAAIAELISKATESLSETKHSGSDVLSQLAADAVAQKQAHEAIRNRAGEALGKFSDQAATDLAQAKKSVDALIETLNAKLTLQAPVTYWSAKRRYHRMAASSVARKVSAYVIACLLVVTVAGSHLLETEAKNALALPLWHVALFATLVAFFIWGARILVRNMLSHQHLEADAHERVVIANTFLALIRGGRITEQTIVKDLLAALLRHSPDGIVKDDAMPLITDLIRGKHGAE